MIDELSIIIPTLNEEKYLSRALQSIVEQSYQGKLKVVVIDGGSKDNTLKIANEFKDKIKDLIIITTAKGISHQSNIGSTKAKYKFLMFLDADIYLPKNFLSKITKKINPNENFLGQPMLLPMDGNFMDYLYVFVAYLVIILMSFFKPIVAGMCFLTTQENHQKINGFNEKVVYAEDIDYGFRSVKNNAKYHLYFNCYLFASTRRGKQIGRTKLSLTWIRWYFDYFMHGPLTDESRYNYPFGNH